MKTYIVYLVNNEVYIYAKAVREEDGVVYFYSSLNTNMDTCVAQFPLKNISGWMEVSQKELEG